MWDKNKMHGKGLLTW
jgi:hypothetical protein